MKSTQNEEIEKTWDDFWKKKDKSDSDERWESSGVLNRIIRYLKQVEREFNLDKWYKEVILKELPRKDSSFILEAGCGEGETAVNIYSDNNNYFLLDKSGKALEIARSRFNKQDFSGHYIKGSIFEFPFKSNSFDAVLSIGIFEHFQESQHRQLYDEHLRITKKNGRLIILVPNKNAWFYRIGKWYAQKHNMWEFGFEEPLGSIKPFYRRNKSVRHITEYSGGFLTQFYFTMFIFKKIKHLKMAYLGIVSIVNRLFWFANHFRFFGFYIVNVTEKV